VERFLRVFLKIIVSARRVFAAIKKPWPGPKKNTLGRIKKGKIVVAANGPYRVSGRLPLAKEIAKAGKEGFPEKWLKGKRYPLQEEYELCRCGRSANNPFCDGRHGCVGFDGTETASRKSHAEQAEITAGPGLDLHDAEPLCSVALFCHPQGDTWQLTLGSADPRKRKVAIQQACHCPSGRLVAHAKDTGEPIEPKFAPSISLVEDPHTKSSGPIWVKGGVAVESADGTVYEIRNRVTLCRCGQSKNKPFCDGSHIKMKFNDGDGSLNK
jgi:CDGSH-type Zn-finger protein